jgi:hypothetical protein
MGRLHDWWQRLAGAPAQTEAPPRAATPRPKPRPASEGLALVDDLPTRRPSRVGAVGFDPYASDAGFASPHSWDRVDHD